MIFNRKEYVPEEKPESKPKTNINWGLIAVGILVIAGGLSQVLRADSPLTHLHDVDMIRLIGKLAMLAGAGIVGAESLRVIVGNLRGK